MCLTFHIQWLSQLLFSNLPSNISHILPHWRRLPDPYLQDIFQALLIYPIVTPTTSTSCCHLGVTAHIYNHHVNFQGHMTDHPSSIPVNLDNLFTALYPAVTPKWQQLVEVVGVDELGSHRDLHYQQWDRWGVPESTRGKKSRKYGIH